MKNIFDARDVRALLIAASLLLSACGGGSGSGGGGSTNSASDYSIVGMVTGLTGSVVLQNNGGDNLTVSADGPFIFNRRLTDGANYHVTVLTPPPEQFCTVNLGSGTVSGANVTNVVVTCAASAHIVGGTISGVVGTVVLQDNYGDDLGITSDGSFQFPTKVAVGANYNVTVLSTATGYGCSVAHGAGLIAAVDISDVAVTCAANHYKLGGAVTHLDSGKSLVLQNNGADDLTVSTNGDFQFSTTVPYDTGYDVSVATQPAYQSCTVTSGSANMPAADVADVAVDCVCDPGGAVDKNTDNTNCGSCGNACAGGGACVAGNCQAASCNDGIKNQTETDVDCGGSCTQKCALNQSCSLNSDCTTGLCGLWTHTCQQPSCSDGIQDGNETDKDCGGSVCDSQGSTCAIGQRCQIGADCTSGSCISNLCSP